MRDKAEIHRVGRRNAKIEARESQCIVVQFKASDTDRDDSRAAYFEITTALRDQIAELLRSFFVTKTFIPAVTEIKAHSDSSLAIVESKGSRSPHDHALSYMEISKIAGEKLAEMSIRARDVALIVSGEGFYWTFNDSDKKKHYQTAKIPYSVNPTLRWIVTTELKIAVN